MVHRRFAVLAVAVVALICLFSALAGWSYTQSGAGVIISNLVPMGHEWITRMAAIELLGYTPADPPDVTDPNDPRNNPNNKIPQARNPNLSGAQAEVQRIKGQVYDDQRYASRYKPIYDAIVGERWVDIGGYNVIAGSMPWANDCFDGVAQEPAEVQYDHFMRRYDDANAAGGPTAAYSSQVRFIKYFVAAAMAPQTIISVYDGGAANSTSVEVDRNYFLFGRAVHLFEDSFSSEHTVRIQDDSYTSVRQVKAYLCTKGAEQHSHAKPILGRNYDSGDVVWVGDSKWDPLWKAYKASNMKIPALAATEATKDLWAAFIRTMATSMDQRQAVAVTEATTLVTNWLSYNENQMKTWYDDPSHRIEKYVLADGQSGAGQTQSQCMKDLGEPSGDQMTRVHQLEATQRVCLYNAKPWAGYEDLFDPSMRQWFSWRWKNWPNYLDPNQDPNWKIPDLPADNGIRVRIKSVANQQYMTAPGGLVPDAWVYNRPGPPLDFIVVGSKDNGVFRLVQDPSLFLSYRLIDGPVKLYKPYNVLDPTSYFTDGPSNFQITRWNQSQEWSIQSIPWRDLGDVGYMWYYDGYQSPYISGTGNPANTNSRWFIEPTGGDSAVGTCCWDRATQACSLNSTCDTGGEGCIYSGQPTKQYGSFQCSVAKCCWDRVIQSCTQSSQCDSGGEGCVTSGTNTFTYGRSYCSACPAGTVYNPSTRTCVPK